MSFPPLTPIPLGIQLPLAAALVPGYHRLDILEEAIEHEMYHRGQLTVYARLLGLEPALSRESAQHPFTRFTDRV